MREADVFSHVNGKSGVSNRSLVPREMFILCSLFCSLSLLELPQMLFAWKSNKHIYAFFFFSLVMLVITLGTFYAVMNNPSNPRDLSKKYLLGTHFHMSSCSSSRQFCSISLLILGLRLREQPLLFLWHREKSKRMAKTINGS